MRVIVEATLLHSALLSALRVSAYTRAAGIVAFSHAVPAILLGTVCSRHACWLRVMGLVAGCPLEQDRWHWNSVKQVVSYGLGSPRRSVASRYPPHHTSFTQWKGSGVSSYMILRGFSGKNACSP